MKHEDLFNTSEGTSLADRDSLDFPVEMIFMDEAEDKVKKMKITEETWEQAEEIFGNKEDVNKFVVYKYMAETDTSEVEIL